MKFTFAVFYKDRNKWVGPYKDKIFVKEDISQALQDVRSTLHKPVEARKAIYKRCKLKKV